jgi:hypothetical protein
LTALVEQIVGDPLLHRRLAVGARAYARRQSWDAILDGLIDNYASVLASARALRAA